MEFSEYADFGKGKYLHLLSNITAYHSASVGRFLADRCYVSRALPLACGQAVQIRGVCVKNWNRRRRNAVRQYDPRLPAFFCFVRSGWWLFVSRSWTMVAESRDLQFLPVGV